MSANWINAEVTKAPRTYPHWFGGLGPGDIVCDEVAKRLRATTAPWGSANTLLSWFGSASRIQRTHLLDRGDFTAPPVLVVSLDTGDHLEIPTRIDINKIRVNVAIVCYADSLAGVIGEGEASVDTIFAYLKRFLSYDRQRQLTVTINSQDIDLAKNGPTIFGAYSYVPRLSDGPLAAWIMPIDYAVGVDVPSGQIANVKAVDANA